MGTKGPRVCWAVKLLHNTPTAPMLKGEKKSADGSKKGEWQAAYLARREAAAVVGKSSMS